MADERKVFPIEKILELVTGKKGANVKEVAGYILGRTVDCDTCAKAAAPLATAWLAGWFPRFMSLEWNEGENWEAFVSKASSVIGDNVSITPMSGRLKILANQVLDDIKETNKGIATQTDAVASLEKRVHELEPLQAQAEAARKKCDELEATIKSMKREMVDLNRKTMEFQGKLAIDQEGLMQTIKDAIRDNLKGAVIGAPAAQAGANASEPGAQQAEVSVEEEFGFGSPKTDADGFGF